jgi:hypothetical protein
MCRPLYTPGARNTPPSMSDHLESNERGEAIANYSLRFKIKVMFGHKLRYEIKVMFGEISLKLCQTN